MASVLFRVRSLFCAFSFALVLIGLSGCPAGPELSVVPSVSGELESDALAALAEAGLAAGDSSTAYHDEVAAGHVILQNPYAGVTVLRGTAVALVISDGPRPVGVPDVIGMSESAAVAALAAVGLSSSVTGLFSESAVGDVLGQSPAGGSYAQPGTVVDLQVSRGPEFVTVPDVTGLGVSDAEAALAGSLLFLADALEVWDETVAAGLVIDQTPAAGATVSQMTGVEVVVSKGPAPFAMPSVTGLLVDEAHHALAAAGLAFVEVIEAVDEFAAPDVVFGQTPAAGGDVWPETEVQIVVSLGSEAMVLHTQVWSDVIAGAATDNLLKYGIYASRSLMVSHPEVYLAADSLWMNELVTVYGGWQAEYEHRDRAQDIDYWFNVGGPIYDALTDDATLDGTEFLWKSFRYNEHRANLLNLREFYDARAPFRNWLDMRLPMLWNSIKGIAWQMPSLSIGEAYYFHVRKAGFPAYLLITDAERAYVAVSVADNLNLYYPAEENMLPTGDVDGEIVLVMNDRYVWYPLMGRDDTGEDPLLASVVAAYCNPDAMPFLTRAESDLLEHIAAATALTDDSDMQWATLFASRLGDLDGWLARVTREFSSELLPDQYAAYDVTGATPYELVALNIAVTEIANRLSPAAAVLAVEVRENSADLDGALSAMSSTYLEWFGRDDGNSVAGAYPEIWLPSLDDKVISKVGYALSEACITGAALYIAGIPGWSVWVTHGWFGQNNISTSLSGVYAGGGGRSLWQGLYEPGRTECLSGPISGSAFGSAVNALVYRFGSGFLYTGESAAAFPFTNMDWAESMDVLTEAGEVRPDARFATGNPNAVAPITISNLQAIVADMADDWPRFVAGPAE